MIGRTVGHYRILERLGGGGMGVVYKAEDLTLDRPVALKFLPPELTRDEDAKKRFLIEAKAAAKLDHPNICPVHEVGESDDGQTFIAMAYYEGESLAKRLERGAIPVDEAATIAVEVARGLGAAHQAGIIHRDIKPANVMLTAKGGVKIVDFGVAKLAGVTMTHGGSSPGTLAYMAPEQIRGEPVTPATDLWALGAVFYEMMTGSRPFRGDYEQAVAYTILNEPPVPLDQTLPTRPPVLDSVIAKALTKDSKQRYQTAEALIEGLETVTGVREAAAAAQVRANRIRHLAGIVALAVIVVAAVGGWIWTRRTSIVEAPTAAASTPAQPAGPTLEPKRVMVAVFENRSGDPSLDPVGRYATDSITDALARIQVDVMPSSYALNADEAATTDTASAGAENRAIVLAAKSGSGLLVIGEYYAEGSMLSLRARVVETSTRKTLSVLEPATSARANPSEAVSRMQERVRDAIAVRVLGSAGMRTMTAYEPRPPRYEAYRELLLARESANRDDYAAYEAHIEKAVKLDPECVSALQPWVFVLQARGDVAGMKQVLARARELRSNLTPVGQAGFDAWEAWLEHRHEDAVVAGREVVRLAPGDVWAKPELASYLAATSRYQEAVRVLSEPAAWELVLDPTKPREGGLSYFMLLSFSLGLLDEHERELEEARRAKSIYPAEGVPLWLEARALAALGRLDELEAVFNESLQKPVRATTATPGFVLWSAASVLRTHGRRQESVEVTKRAIAWIEQHPEQIVGSTSWPGYMHFAVGDLDRATSILQAAAQQNAGNDEGVLARARLAVVHAAKGDRRKALAIEAQLEKESKPEHFGRRTYMRAMIHAQLGDRDRAVELIRMALAEGLRLGKWDLPSAVVLGDEPALASLRGYPPFEELLKPKG